MWCATQFNSIREVGTIRHPKVGTHTREKCQNKFCFDYVIGGNVSESAQICARVFGIACKSIPFTQNKNQIAIKYDRHAHNFLKYEENKL